MITVIPQTSSTSKLGRKHSNLPQALSRIKIMKSSVQAQIANQPSLRNWQSINFLLTCKSTVTGSGSVSSLHMRLVSGTEKTHLGTSWRGWLSTNLMTMLNTEIDFLEIGKVMGTTTSQPSMLATRTQTFSRIPHILTISRVFGPSSTSRIAPPLSELQGSSYLTSQEPNPNDFSTTSHTHKSTI